MKLTGQEKAFPEDGVFVLGETEFKGPLVLTEHGNNPLNLVNLKYLEDKKANLDLGSLDGVIPVARFPKFTGDLVKEQSSANINLVDRGIVRKEYTKYSSNAKGIITGVSNITPSDIPSLNWSKLRTKPNSLNGYGITNGVNLSIGTVTGNLRSPSHPTTPTDAVTKGYVDSNFGTVESTVETGDILKHIKGDNIGGYLRTNGAVVEIDDYPELYSVIGNTYAVYSAHAYGKPWRFFGGTNGNPFEETPFNVRQLGPMSSINHVIQTSENRSLTRVCVVKDKIHIFTTVSIKTISLKENGEVDELVPVIVTGISPSLTGNNFDIVVIKDRIYYANYAQTESSRQYGYWEIGSDGLIGDRVVLKAPLDYHGSNRYTRIFTSRNGDLYVINRFLYRAKVGPDGYPGTLQQIQDFGTNTDGTLGGYLLPVGEGVNIVRYGPYSGDYITINYSRVEFDESGELLEANGLSSYTGTYFSNEPLRTSGNVSGEEAISYNAHWSTSGRRRLRPMTMAFVRSVMRFETGRIVQNPSDSVEDSGMSGWYTGVCPVACVKNRVYQFRANGRNIEYVYWNLNMGSNDYRPHYFNEVGKLGTTHFKLPEIGDGDGVYSYIKT